MIWPRLVRLVLIALVAWGATGAPLHAQIGSAPVQPEATRADLVARLHAADSLGRREESFLLRTRLQNGDFDVGDRIAISYQVAGLERKTDTTVVLAGRVLRLPEPLGEMDLTGVLRSELPDSITNRVAKYFRIATVHVTPLIRLSVSGAVRQAGYFYLPPDIPLSDVIMRTGGQDATADLNDVVIKRGNEVLWNKEDVHAALVDGVTLERLNLEPGDQLVVGAKHQSHLLQGLYIASTVFTVLTGLIFTFARIR